ncbi:helix-turn-helix transcriptional regulator [Tetragenococcus halophilus]|uniref:helix-turn-helix transcriptional regulator n=1 Tax=Tetragenococcus halophilus TaxID=51669 RepID=UPI00209B825C|nr:helix-turn-helix transcriptional regulator [Tetragenococcus halophilus]MCO8286660.1 helix-turn-helix transcriptional regulator [Tetragenococcus halophilus]
MWNKIDKLLKEKNMTQYELSKRMNVTSGTISDLKLGRIKKPSFQLACKIADALEISLDELRGEQK